MASKQETSRNFEEWVPSEYQEDVDYIEDGRIVLDTEYSPQEVENDFAAYVSDETEEYFDDLFNKLRKVETAYQILGATAGAGFGLMGVYSFLEGNNAAGLFFTGLGAATATGAYKAGDIQKHKADTLEIENNFDFQAQELGINAYREEDSVIVEVE